MVVDDVDNISVFSIIEIHAIVRYMFRFVLFHFLSISRVLKHYIQRRI